MQQTQPTNKPNNKTNNQTNRQMQQTGKLTKKWNKQTSAHTYTAHVDEDEQELQALVSDNMICTIWDQK